MRATETIEQQYSFDSKEYENFIDCVDSNIKYYTEKYNRASPVYNTYERLLCPVDSQTAFSIYKYYTNLGYFVFLLSSDIPDHNYLVVSWKPELISVTTVKDWVSNVATHCFNWLGCYLEQQYNVLLKSYYFNVHTWKVTITCTEKGKDYIWKPKDSAKYHRPDIVLSKLFKTVSNVLLDKGMKLENE